MEDANPIKTAHDPWEVWKDDKTVARDVREAGYRFFSTGRWYRKGTEAILLFVISGDHSETSLRSVEEYIKTSDSNYSGLFGGDRKTGEAPDWDEEGCGYDEFDIYKDGVLVKEGEKWED